jgi:hypothetical protein
MGAVVQILERRISFTVEGDKAVKITVARGGVVIRVPSYDLAVVVDIREQGLRVIGFR